jgi:hypothetical protein
LTLEQNKHNLSADKLTAEEAQMAVVHISAGRRINGQFAAGVSGNPAGRPKGSRNFATLLAEAIGDEDRQEIVDQAVAKAKAGNVRMATALINKLFPTPRHPAIELEVPEGQEADPRAILTAALRAMAGGVITPEEGLIVARMMEKAARLLLGQRRETPAAKPAQPTAAGRTTRARPPAAETVAKRTPPEAEPGSATAEPPADRLYQGRTPAIARPPAGSAAEGRSSAAAPVNRQYSAEQAAPPQPPLRAAA